MRILPLVLFLAACSGSSSSILTVPEDWSIGPNIDGHNYSTGSVSGNVIQVQDVHYITKSNSNALSGTMSVSFNLSAPLKGTNCSGPATASLYFQRRGDDWNTDGWRWWATFATVTLDHAGNYTMQAPLNGPWTSVQTETAKTNPQDFADAKANASAIGITLGNCTGYGHGGTGPATLTINDFEVTQ